MKYCVCQQANNIQKCATNQGSNELQHFCVFRKGEMQNYFTFQNFLPYTHFTLQQLPVCKHLDQRSWTTIAFRGLQNIFMCIWDASACEKKILELTLVRQLWRVSLGIGSPCRRRVKVAPWHWGMHPNNLYYLSECMSLSFMLR